MDNFTQTNFNQEITINIINEIIKVVPYFNVDIQEQIKLRNKIEEQLNDYEITSKCTSLSTCDILEKAFIFLSCKKLEGMADTTRYNYSLLFKRMNTYFNKPLVSITTIDLRLFLAKEYKNNQTNSLNCKINQIKAFFTWLQDEGYLIQNVTKNLMISKEPYRRRKCLDVESIEKMRNGCSTIRLKALYETILSTGCRVGEISNATIDMINWQENSIIVIGKGNKERKVFFSTRARLFLIEYIGERQNKDILNNSLFIASKYPYDKLGSRSIEREIKTLAKNSGVSENVFPHILRHQYATTAVEQNVPIYILQKLMGHASANVTEKYYQINDSMLKQEYKKIAL